MFKRYYTLVFTLLFTISSWVIAAPLDINTATASALSSTIHGVGQKRAESIIAYRDEHGPFASVDDLARVRGVSVNIVDANRELLVALQPSSDESVGEPVPAQPPQSPAISTADQ